MKTRHFILSILAFLIAFAGSVARAAENLVITEFMAINDTGLRDEDGATSDWIEIYNAGDTAVNLDGWYLTDNDNELTKWRFPAVTLGARSYLTVFASGKDRAPAGGMPALHTSFALDGDGEYLGLVKPDGVTVAWHFSPRYPDQAPDISYGLPLLISEPTTLMTAGAASTAFVPSMEIGADWTGVAYNDSGWISGTTGVGFDGGTNYGAAIGTDIGPQMLGVNPSAYVRVPFNVTDPAAFQELKLRMRYDDGFVGYVNGQEVQRRNAPSPALWNSVATANHGSEAAPAFAVRANFDTVTDAHVLQQQGTAPPASTQNANAGSTGRFLRLISDGANSQANCIIFDQIGSGSFPLITAEFDFRVSSPDAPADGFAFMLIPTSTYGTSGPGVNPIGAVEDPLYAGVFAVGFDVYDPAGTINDVSVNWNGSQRQKVRVPTANVNITSAQFHRARVTVRHVSGGAEVTVVLTANVNGTPGTPYTAINNRFVPGLNPFSSRVQFGGRTGGLNMNVDLDNIAVNYGYATGLVPFEEFDISSNLNSLQSGANVLAIHGLNLSAGDADFLILPELIARSITVQTNERNFFATATPGAANTSGAAEIAPPPTFSVPSGVYTSNLIVGINTPIPDGVIRYTINGARPTATSPIYTTGIGVSNSMQLRALVFAPGYLPSPIDTAHYTILDSNITSFSSNLPLLVLDTFNHTVAADMPVRAPVNMTIIDTVATTGRSSPLGEINFQGRVGLELRGQTSLGFPKKPYNVEIWDETDDGRNVEILNFPPGNDFALLNIYNDKSFMNDFLAHEYFEQMGHYAVRRRYVEVFVNGNRPEGGADISGKVGTNDYVGIFLLLEKIRVDNDRVDITELKPEDNSGEAITGGYMWKKDKNSPGDINFTTSSGQLLKIHEPRPVDITTAQVNWLREHLNEFEAALYGPNWRDPAIGYRKYIDVDSFVDQHWIVEFTKQIDGYRLSNYMQKDRGGKIKMEPIWDWNLSWGNANYLQGGITNGWYYSLLGADNHIWLRRLVGDGGSTAGDSDFVQLTIDRWGELREDIFALPNVLAKVDATAAFLNEAQARDFARWPRLGVYIWPNPNGTGDGRDVDYQTPTSYAGIITQMKRWITGRHTWIDSLYLKRPLLSRTSGPADAPLAMSAPLGTIYYTVDGSDPRLPGGVLNPNARVYTTYFTPPADSQIFARAWHNNAWSPPSKATFGYGVPSLAITEIMYHAPEVYDTNSRTWVETLAEFIEIKNTGSTAIDLTGMTFVNGVGFTFPAGPLLPTGTPTQFDDPGGTPNTRSTLGAGPGITTMTEGPPGGFLRMTHQDTGTNRNRLTFDQTAADRYDRVVAEFDFRGHNLTPPPMVGAPTLQNFDDPGATYTTISYAGSQMAAVAGPDSGSQGRFMRITPAVNSEMDGVFFDRTAAGNYNTVIATFDFRAAGGADGMGFVFLNTATHGISGNVTTGFGEEPNVANAIGIGLDIYANAATAAEPNANHVSLHWNGAQVGSAVTPALTLASGRFHRAQVTIRFGPTTALVSLRITPDINGAGGTPELLFSDVAIPTTPFEGRIGFAARTGGLNANQDVDNINVQYLNEAIPTPAGLSLVLLAATTFGATGAGSTLAHYTDLPNAANVFAINFDMHSSAFINDASVHWNGSSRGSALIPPAVLDLDNNQFHRARLEMVRVSEGARLSVTVTPDIHGTPGAPRTIFSNLLVPGFFPGNSRVEFAARSGGQNIAIDLDRISVAYEKHAPNLLAAGECAVIVRNRAAFEAVYGTGIRILGEYSGMLDNGGERLVLQGVYGNPILDFRYDDDWYPITDGNGFSLVLLDPNNPANTWSDSTSWRPSSQVNGSPGQIDPAPPTFAPILVNEVLSRSVPPLIDAIELYNPTTNSVDVTDWYLSDDFNTPKKYRLPAGSMVPAGGYLVIYETNFNANPGSSSSFALRAEGDEVYVFSGNSLGDLTGYFHGHEFDLVDPDVSIGRHITSEGKEHFVPQTSPTFGAANSGPLVGPVVISEIMYHPEDYPGGIDNSDDEFVELVNITGSPVPLYDTAHTNNVWRLRDAVRFNFPLGTTIAAGERIIVANFDPVQQPDQLQSFRAKYGLSESDRIFGPYGGKLDNSRESVELVKPDAPDLDRADLDYILVDKVRYEDNSPWPLAADGLGRSLQRVDESAYGNDPANWHAALPTAARAYTPGSAPIISAQPADQTVTASSMATFSVNVGGLGPFTYQWRFNGANLAGATNATLTLPSVQLSQAGNYQVVVMSLTGSTESSNAVLTVLQAATFIVQPQSRSINIVGANTSNVTFTAYAIGNGPVTFQWQFNGADIPGATGTNYTVTATTNSGAGVYSVVATDGIGQAFSVPATLRVNIPVSYVRQPQPVIAVEGDTVVFSVLTAGSEPFGYRWRRNSIAFDPPGVYRPSRFWIITNVSSANAGTYSCVTTNSGTPNGLLSAPATLTVLADFDRDGMPDMWERTYGFETNRVDSTNDFDGDTMSNLAEYIAGTNPTNALSYLKINQLSGGGPAILRFDAVSNKNYTVFYRDALDANDWTSLTNVLAHRTNRLEVITDPAAGQQRYYRLQTPFQQ